jgi:myo-inositol-1(or 4)-monophosphatase
VQTRSELLEVAREAASAGSRIVAARFGRAVEDQASKGRTGDWVTEVDRESEAAIRSVLEARAPAIPVLGEEAGGRRGQSYWAVDPLDGTTNFVIGFPVVAVSIALVVDGRPEVAVVEAPLLGLSFHASRGGGAWSGHDRMHVSARPPERAIVATALPFRQRGLLSRYEPVLRRAFDRVEDVRRAGAAALDLAWVAAGVFDGYFELTLSVWDVAAGGLLVEESGGVVTDWDGGPDYLSGNVLAGSPATHEVLLAAATAQDPGRPAPT